VVVVADVAAIGSENVAETVLVRATLTAPVAGNVDVTVGAGFVTVVKVHWCCVASAFPAMSWKPVIRRAVYVVPNASGADGVKVTVDPLTVTVPPIGAAAPVRTSKFVVVADAGAMGSEKVALIVAARATPVALAAGLVATTVGRFRSPPGPSSEHPAAKGRAAIASQRSRRVRVSIRILGSSLVVPSLARCGGCARLSAGDPIVMRASPQANRMFPAPTINGL
jgi:hypothetical protein